MSVIYILCYMAVLLLCVGGNMLVSLVVLRNRNMRSVTNLFILNLAISDLLIGVFCVPTTLIDSLISGEKVEGCEKVWSEKADFQSTCC
uniref:G-protein coupled receptors family 1 profile domain-containing protein n=1 Tax=Oncorhynchus kisutch TaxID=8019 RepID=A0A8C7CWW7_ONCKI